MDSSEEAWKELHGLRENFKELREGVEGLIKDKGLGNANSSSSNINFNAGGLALWAALTACLVMLAVTIVGSIFIAIALSDLNRQAQELRQADATMQAYINAGLVQPKEPEE